MTALLPLVRAVSELLTVENGPYDACHQKSAVPAAVVPIGAREMAFTTGY